MKVIYLLNVFPKISETFILNEMLRVQRKGIVLEVYAFKDEKESVVHPGVREVREVRYFRKVALAAKLAPHVYWLLKRPMGYGRAAWLALRHGAGIRKNFILDLSYAVDIDKRKPDHVHAHFADGEASNLAMVYSVLSGVPFTFTTHMHDIFRETPPNFPIKSRLAKKHVTISEYNRKHLVERFGVRPEDIDIIHCGVDFEKIPAGARFSEESRLIYCVARLHMDKSLDVLVDACAILKKRGVEFSCEIAGEGGERASLEKQIQSQGLVGMVRLLGNQTQDQVFAKFRQARIKALSSHIEGIPVSLMEAMAFRVPVVATAISGIPELIEDGWSGYLVPVGESQVLAERMEALLSDSHLCERFVEKGYQKVAEDFNLDKETDKLIRLWTAPKAEAA